MAGTPYPIDPYFSNDPPPPSYQAAAPYQTPMSKIELKVSCRKLLDLDVFSKSDPFVVMFVQTQNKSWREVGRTETIMDTLDPDFVKAFIVDYFFEEQQMLKFEVYDADSHSPDLSEHDFIGRLVTSIGSIVGENDGKLEHPMQNPDYSRKSPGTIIVRAEEVNANRDFVTLHLCGKKLDKKDFFGKSDPFLVFERCNEDNTYSIVHKTEVIKSTLNPQWLPIKVSSQVLCNCDNDRTIKVSCYDWNQNGSHEIIGSFQTTLNDFVGFKNGRPSYYNLINPKKQSKKSYKSSGTIHILDCALTQKATFLDYIKGGLELNFVVAIDFTASNGNPQTIQSLHYNGGHYPSQYVQALQALGSIIEDYDTDKLFPAFGFGAKLPPSFNVSHEFALNFNPANPLCQGINGIIGAYYNSIANVQLYGPTNFAPVIFNTARIARENISKGALSQYYILLILTDGIISDMEKTKEAIVHAASLPISIIIVGVGKAEFDAMEELDGDVVRLSYRGKQAERDIVQFVAFRDYMQGHTYDISNGVRLSKDVLSELPDQLLEYMEKRNIKPNAPPPQYIP